MLKDRTLRDGSSFGCLMTMIIVVATIALAVSMTHLSLHSGSSGETYPDFSAPERHRTR